MNQANQTQQSSIDYERYSKAARQLRSEAFFSAFDFSAAGHICQTFDGYYHKFSEAIHQPAAGSTRLRNRHPPLVTHRLKSALDTGFVEECSPYFTEISQ